VSDKQVVISVFPDEAAADAAVGSLKSWDKVSNDVKLGAIGVLVLDEQGQVKTQKLGKRSIGKGAGIGVVLAVVAPPLGVGTMVAGGLLGALHKKGLGLDDADRERIAAQLTSGKAAVGVLARSDEANTIASKLKELGGDSEVHEATDEALEQAAAEVPEVPKS
jgi:uncharacterized membrane protein